MFASQQPAVLDATAPRNGGPPDSYWRMVADGRSPGGVVGPGVDVGGTIVNSAWSSGAEEFVLGETFVTAEPFENNESIGIDSDEDPRAQWVSINGGEEHARAVPQREPGPVYGSGGSSSVAGRPSPTVERTLTVDELLNPRSYVFDFVATGEGSNGGRRPFNDTGGGAATGNPLLGRYAAAERRREAGFGQFDSSGVGGQAASLGLDLLPGIGSVKSFFQMFTGADSITGDPVNRWLEAAGIVLGLAPGGKALVKGEKIADVAIGATKLSTEAKNVLRKEATDIWQAETGRRAIWDGLQVHHRVPLEYAHLFPDANPNRLANLIGVDGKTHTQITNAWNDWGRSFGGKSPTQADLIRQAVKIDAKFGDSFKYVR